MHKSWRRSKGWATNALLVALLACSPTVASATDSQLMEYQGQKGLWFPMDKAKQLLTDVASLPEVRKQLALIEARLGLEKERSALLGKNVLTVEKIAETWKETAKGQAEVLARRSSVLQSPYLWTAIGFVVGVGATIAIVYVAKAGPAN